MADEVKPSNRALLDALERAAVEYTPFEGVDRVGDAAWKKLSEAREAVLARLRAGLADSERPEWWQKGGAVEWFADKERLDKLERLGAMVVLVQSGVLEWQSKAPPISLREAIDGIRTPAPTDASRCKRCGGLFADGEMKYAENSFGPYHAACLSGSPTPAQREASAE